MNIHHTKREGQHSINTNESIHDLHQSNLLGSILRTILPTVVSTSSLGTCPWYDNGTINN